MNATCIILIILFIAITLITVFYTIWTKRKNILPIKGSSSSPPELPEKTLLDKLDKKEPIFNTDSPVINKFTSNNNNVVIIDLEEGTGKEYVQKVGKDTLTSMFEKLYEDPFYARLVSRNKKLEALAFFIKKIKLLKEDEYRIVVKFYKEMAQELSGVNMEDSDIDNIDKWNPDFRKWFEFSVLLDVQLETFVWLYIHFTKDLDLPKKWVDYFGTIGNNCSFMTAKNEYTETNQNLIARNFDWMTNTYDNTPVYCFNHKKYGIFNIGLPGMVFCTLTAINNKGVWCSFNNLSYSIGAALKPNAPPIVIDMFFKLKQSDNANQLYSYMKKVDYDINIMYFSGDREGTYCLAQKVDKENNFKVPEFDSSVDIAARANKVLNLEWYKEQYADKDAWGSDSLHRQAIMMNQLKFNKGQLNDKLFMHIFQEPLYKEDLNSENKSKNFTYGVGPTLYNSRGKNADHTVYQCVYNPARMTLYLRGNSKLQIKYPWYEIDLRSIFS